MRATSASFILIFICGWRGRSKEGCGREPGGLGWGIPWTSSPSREWWCGIEGSVDRRKRLLLLFARALGREENYVVAPTRADESEAVIVSSDVDGVNLGDNEPDTDFILLENDNVDSNGKDPDAEFNLPEDDKIDPGYMNRPERR